jgi:ATP/maltotriose-dependent transcriptional regulator MalT
MGVAWLALGELAFARRDAEEGLRLVRVNGDRAKECNPLCCLSILALYEDDDARALALARSAVETALAVESRQFEMFARLQLGRAELALGRHAAAALAFEQARVLAMRIDHHPAQHEVTAELARVALAQGDVAVALQQVEHVLAHMVASNTLDGAETSSLVDLCCHQVLARVGDPRAAAWLERAHTHLQATAASITDARLRQCFLANIPEHREIVALWAARA